jgi:toxin-antitoxin system PIN domain toxin
MRAVDTNILVYSHIISSRHHEKALLILRELGESPFPWAIPWPCIYEFLRVVTHPRVYHPPSPPEIALADLRQILGSPSLQLLSETPTHPELMDALIRETGVKGNLIHDAHIAALCLEHGVRELITGDRDFSRFAALKIMNPF